MLAVLIIALANVICYITHEKSLLHGHLNLPKVLFISNRCLSSDYSSFLLVVFHQRWKHLCTDLMLVLTVLP